MDIEVADVPTKGVRSTLDLVPAIAFLSLAHRATLSY